ncbi:hypothetical protein KR018_007691 [Drosophila ironensis]|nr:hypothetical protein KR018_007691 [Drosophila ironensis]
MYNESKDLSASGDDEAKVNNNSEGFFVVGASSENVQLPGDLVTLPTPEKMFRLVALLFQMSELLNTGLSREAVAVCIQMIILGLEGSGLAEVIIRIRSENGSKKGFHCTSDY